MTTLRPRPLPSGAHSNATTSPATTTVLGSGLAGAALAILLLSGCGSSSSSGSSGGFLPVPAPTPAPTPTPTPTPAPTESPSSAAASVAGLAMAGIDAAVGGSLDSLESGGSAPASMADHSTPRRVLASLLPFGGPAELGPSAMRDYDFPRGLDYEVNLDGDGGQDPWPGVSGLLSVQASRTTTVAFSASGGAARYQATISAISDITATDAKNRTITWPIGTQFSWQADVTWARTGLLTGTWTAISSLTRNDLPIAIRDAQGRVWSGDVDYHASATTAIVVNGTQRSTTRSATGQRRVVWQPVAGSGATGSATATWTLMGPDQVTLLLEGRDTQGNSYGGTYGPYSRSEIRSRFQTPVHW
jgi:hypothetical protein